MSTQLITLQDHDVAIRDADDVHARSPGFANFAETEPVFGEQAQKLARLHPRQNLNQFWSQLSLDPLTIRNKHFRHAGDVAHGHLKHLTAEFRPDDDSIIAVPSHYSRNQLAVLLGITKACELPVSGVVDLSLLQAMASDSQADHVIIVDLQLHQAILTSFRRAGGVMQRDRVVQVPASGLLALQDAWTNMIADAFIRQTRFDPKHNAEVEQYLYNQLGDWIARSRESGELGLEVNHQGRTHQAQINHEAFGQRARNVFDRIRKELDQLTTRDTSIHILRSHLHLPGLTAALPGIAGLEDELLAEMCLRNLDHIRPGNDQVHFITKLPLDGGAGTTSAAPTSVRLPSHVLINHRAIALPAGRLALGAPAPGEYARIVPLPGLDDNSAVIFNRTRNALSLELAGITGVTLNGKAAGDGDALALGDSLHIGPVDQTLTLIQVE